MKMTHVQRTHSSHRVYVKALVLAGLSLHVGSASAVLEEIVVTAQKRPERLIDIPVTISAVSADDFALAGTDSLESLNKLVPGVYINTPVYYLSPTIRGVGSTLSVNNESNVALYIDGVYQPAQASNVFDLASVEGVEVLKGPQGTIFGRNATGGAILVKTLDPSFERDGKFAISYGRFDEVRAKSYINLPINDTVAANLALNYRHTPGYIRDVRTDRLANEAETFGARGKVLLQPLDNLNVTLTASHTKFDDPTASSYQNYKGQNVLAPVPGAGPVASDRFEVSHNSEAVLRTTAQEYNARIDYDTGTGTLSSITAFKDDKLTTTNDGDNTYLDIFRIDFTYKNETVTQELNFTSTGDNFNYVVGAYYYRNKTYYSSFQYNRVEFLEQENNREAFAGYADGTYEFGDLALIAGIRYSTEDREMGNALLPHPMIPAPGSRSIQKRDSSWTPRVGLRYALTDHSNLYAIYSRGFKSGTFNGTSLTDPGVSPETIDAYEIGYKAVGDRFTLNSSAYYYDYQDVQASTLIIRDGVALSSVVNAAEARIYGAEFDASYLFSDMWSMRGALAYTNAEYSSFPDAPGYQEAPGGGFMTVPVDASGNPMVRTPKYQASAQINYLVPVGGNTLEFSLSPSYQSKVYFDSSARLNQGAVFLLDASIAMNLANGMKVTVFGRNITDRKYYTQKGYSTLNISSNFAKPMTYGVEFAWDLL
ncbi:TonB-dependent receptor [Kineobactrum salinum]|uniref:TonB-dependent receptor n=1 Tax=Kineobactrum salinum TaxID=2708301 RepID=A0A6C0U0F9_9GAMM|nr:TonB-dependent receptor [Kineobactrum salinum]QIB65511.1 TonB-dependent receptor [Kineobactrum salinum]